MLRFVDAPNSILKRPGLRADHDNPDSFADLTKSPASFNPFKLV